MLHFRVVEHAVKSQHTRDSPNAVTHDQDGQVRLSVKQYIPKAAFNGGSGHGSVTIIAAHANGFPKELYEPFWDDLYESMTAQNRQIRGIWISDVYNQGQSGVLNERILENDPSWWDHGRDLLFLINQFQTEMPHPIVGIGHSMGGMHMTHLSLLHPRLLDALILVDPVVRPESPSMSYALPSTYRRDIWPSREDASERFKSSAMYRTWDSRVLEKWVKHGLRDLPTELYPDQQGVTLATPKAQEVFTFLRTDYETALGDASRRHAEAAPEDFDDRPFYRPEPPHVFRRLPEVKPPVLYIFGLKSDLWPEEARRRNMEATGVAYNGSGGAAAGRVSEKLLNCGHLVPMELPGKCAAQVADYLDLELARWEREDQARRRKWQKLPRSQRIGIDQLWKEKIGEAPARPSRKSGKL